MQPRGQMLPAANGLGHAAEASGHATEEKLTPLSLSKLGFLWAHPCERPAAAAKRYPAWVARAPDLEIWPGGLRPQIFSCGDDLLSQCKRKWRAGFFNAYTQAGLSMTHMAKALGLSVSRVCGLIAQYENEPSNKATNKACLQPLVCQIKLWPGQLLERICTQVVWIREPPVIGLDQ
jgi:hypothetical protein